MARKIFNDRELSFQLSDLSRADILRFAGALFMAGLTAGLLVAPAFGL